MVLVVVVNMLGQYSSVIIIVMIILRMELCHVLQHTSSDTFIVARLDTKSMTVHANRTKRQTHGSSMVKEQFCSFAPKESVAPKPKKTAQLSEDDMVKAMTINVKSTRGDERRREIKTLLAIREHRVHLEGA